MIIKYKLGELAKDFGLGNKEIVAALGKFGEGKKHTTVLTEQELDVVFYELTRQHSTDSFAQYFVESKPPEPVKSGDAKVDEAFRKKAEQQQQQARKKDAPAAPSVTVKERERHVVDTRAAVVQIDKYNEKYENIAQSSSPGGGNNNNRRRSNAPQGRKQKFNQRSNQRGNVQSNKRETEAQRLQRLQLEKARHAQLRVSIPDEISVGELASRLKVTAPAVIKKLMGLGVMASISEVIDFDTASLVADELGAKVEHEVHVTIEERLNISEEAQDDEKDLVERPPVVVVMGHVDHGKTSLLDYIRNSSVASGEAGGITQHIGAYRVKVGDKSVTFLDTPGHEAFTSMRARGASVTDIAILVVAADDGIMPQTVEAINHAKAAGVSVIVAINKIDKEESNVEKVKQSLTEYELVPEEWGGETICVPVSAKTGQGVDTLLEMVTLVSDVKELKANPDRQARGTVIEARLDKGRGPVATILIQNGTLHQGDVVIAGTAVGRVRAMLDDRGRKIESAGPSVPVEITGLEEVPSAGDVVNAVEDERLARELVSQRRTDVKEEQFRRYTKVTLDNLFSQIEEGALKELPIIIKADVHGSCEALAQSLQQLTSDEVRVNIIHTGVGGINTSDVMLAEVSGAVVIGFNVRPDPTARQMADEAGIDLKMYRVIYDAINEVRSAMKGMQAPKIREVEQGRVEVREVYKISSIGTVAGCYVQNGTVTRNSLIRIVRDNIIIGDDKVGSLRRFKDDVKEVAQGFECGITLDKFSDVKVGDIFETYIMEEYRED